MYYYSTKKENALFNTEDIDSSKLLVHTPYGKGKIRIEIPTKKDQENIAKEYVIKKNIINTTRRNLMKLEKDLKEISEKYFQEVK